MLLEELTLYNDLVRKGSYLIASDTFLEDLPRGSFPNRPWDKGNNPATAVEEFLKTNRRFKNDISVTNKLGISASPTGYLKCVRDLSEVSVEPIKSVLNCETVGSLTSVAIFQRAATRLGA